ncbi:MFS transporter [Actinomadura darangshiensis]|uniref:MFS transporter n=1 Tax=Actinomadura darangshiensis TaxID=705336 RepID=A0A4R5BMH3_9ACTN|nr:MFS transporter [Actinomadura darangshiensis]TDD86513.1 MFS transporter [Actinomadura darangshiensis]
MTTGTATPAPARAGRREWLGVVVLALPTLLVSVDLSVLFLALPRMSADLRPSATDQLWILDVYGLMLASFLIPMGVLGDRTGRRRLLLAGAAVFGAASVWAAWAGGPGALIAARTAMGVAAATLAPSSLALINGMFPDPKQRSAAVAVWMSCFMGGSIVGPIVGGTMLAAFWWGSIFLLAVPIIGLLLVTGPLLLPESRGSTEGRLDPVSAALAPAALLPVMYSVTEGARDGWDPGPVFAGLTGLVLGVVFWRRQSRSSHPVLDPALFRNRTYRSALVLSVSGGAIQGGALLMANLYLQSVAGLSPLSAGLWMIPATLAMVAGIMAGTGAGRALRPAHVTAAGLLLSAAGYLMVTGVGTGTGVPVLLIAGFAVAMAGIGPGIGLGYGMMLGSVPPEKAGAGSATVEAGGQFGVATGIAVLGSVGAAAYRDHLRVPAGTPALAADAARDGITGAVAVTRHSSAAWAGGLSESARHAFTAGLHSVAAVGAVLFLVLAGFVLVALRHVPPVGAADPRGERRGPPQ